MKLAEKDNLVQTLKNQIDSLQKEWVKNRDSATLSLLDKAHEELKKAKEISITPEVGLGATGGCGSDCYAYTVVWVSPDGKKIDVTEDSHHPVPGFDYYSKQEYTYSTNMGGDRIRYRLRKDGSWVKDGEPMRGGSRIYLGHRRYYQDPSF